MSANISTEDISKALDRVTKICDKIEKLESAVDQNSLTPESKAEETNLIKGLISNIHSLFEAIGKEGLRAKALNDEQASINKRQEEMLVQQNQAIKENAAMLAQYQKDIPGKNDDFTGCHKSSKDISSTFLTEQELTGFRDLLITAGEFKESIATIAIESEEWQASLKDIATKLQNLTDATSDMANDELTGKFTNLSDQVQALGRMLQSATPLAAELKAAAIDIKTVKSELVRASNEKKASSQTHGPSTIAVPAKRAPPASPTKRPSKRQLVNKSTLSGSSNAPIELPDTDDDQSVPDVGSTATKKASLGRVSSDTIGARYATPRPTPLSAPSVSQASVSPSELSPSLVPGSLRPSAQTCIISFTNWGNREAGVKDFVTNRIARLIHFGVAENAIIASLVGMARAPPGEWCPMDFFVRGKGVPKVKEPGKRKPCDACLPHPERRFCARALKPAEGSKFQVMFVPRDIS